MTGATIDLARFVSTASTLPDGGTILPVARLTTRLDRAGFSAIGTADSRAAGAQVGAEVQARIDRSLASHVEGGWDPLVAGLLVGSAAAAARALGLSPELTAQTLSTAATQASGFEALTGTSLGDYQERHAVRCGIASAQLVQSGLEAPANGLEGRRGLAALLAPSTTVDDAVEALGEAWISRGDAHADA